MLPELDNSAIPSSVKSSGPMMQRALSNSARGTSQPVATTIDQAELTVMVVSYNSKELTLQAIRTLQQNAGDVAMEILVWDNASQDGSAEAIREAFPDIRVFANAENIGFAAANNRLAEMARTEWLLLLNPDTETHSGAIENLLAFARARPECGIVGGRTVFPDGSLNPASCWNRMTVWSLVCSAFGLRRAFPNSALFNPEGIGGWQRNTVRQVDIVVGCFMLLRTALWRELGGFCEKYFMYGEEADLCLRAAKLGYSPMITPEAEIMHLVGATTPELEDKVVRLMQAKATLIRDHWHPVLAPVGLALLWLWTFNHRLMSLLMEALPGKVQGNSAWNRLWCERRNWLAGYCPLSIARPE